MKLTTKIILLASISCNILLAQNNQKTKNLLNQKTQLKALQKTLATVYKPGKEVRYNWDSTNVSWVYSDSARTIYNTVANSTRIKKYYNFSTYKDTNIYNAAGYLIKTISFYLNGNNYDTSFVNVYTYNSQNQIIVDASYYYSLGNIAGGGKNTNTYNASGQLTSVVYQNLISSNFVNNYKTDFIYSGTNTSVPLDKVINYNWINNTSSWQITDSIFNIVFYTWTGNLDNSTPKLYYSNDANGNQLLDSCYYDANNNQTKFIEYKKQGNNWVYYYKQTDSYLYDSNNNMTQDIEFYFNPGNTSQTIANYGRKTVYSDFQTFLLTGITHNELNASNISLFPNPNNGLFQVTSPTNVLKTICVLNALGETVYKTDFDSNILKEINLSNLPKGVYFVRLCDATKNYSTKKMVIN